MGKCDLIVLISRGKGDDDERGKTLGGGDLYEIGFCLFYMATSLGYGRRSSVNRKTGVGPYRTPSGSNQLPKYGYPPRAGEPYVQVPGDDDKS